MEKGSIQNTTRLTIVNNISITCMVATMFLSDKGVMMVVVEVVVVVVFCSFYFFF